MKERYEILKQKKYYFFTLAFLIPFLTFVITYIANGYYPIGKNQILIVDAYHQYFQFFQVLRDKLINGGGFFYTFSMGLGSDFIGIMAYYLMSPFNLFLIAIPEDFVIVFFEFLIAFKIGLAGLSFSIFLYSIYKKKDYALVVFSIIYSLSGFICGYYWNIMWLDVIILFPLAILGIKNVVCSNSYKFYFFTLLGCFIFNYYMSIFVVIGIILFYFGYSFVYRLNLRDFFKKGFKTLYYSTLAALCSAFLLLPTAIGLSRVYKTPAAFSDKIKFVNDFRDLMANALAFNQSTVRDGLPNIYSGLIIIFFIFVYIFVKGISKREKLISVFFILFLYLSTNVNVLDYIWHGFRYSNMLPSRFTFILSFIVGIVCYKTYENLESANIKMIFPFSFLSLFIVYYVGQERDWEITVANLLLMFVYIICTFFIIKGEDYGKKIFCILLSVELIVNGGFGLYSGGCTDYYEFIKGKEEIKVLQGETDKKEFKRQESMDRFTFNDPALYGYNGLSLFSSTLDKRVSTFLEKMGHSTSPIGNRVYYNYTTPVINGFLNIGYLYERNNPVDVFGFKEISSWRGVRLLENEYCLPLAFEPKGDTSKDEFKYDNIENQEELFKMITGVEKDIFTEVPRISESGVGLKITNAFEDKVFFNMKENVAHLTLEYEATKDGYYYFDSDHVEDDKFVVDHYGERTSFDIRNKNIVGGLHFNKGDIFKINVEFGEGDSEDFFFRVFKLEEENYVKGFENVMKNGAKNVNIHKEKVSFDIDSDSGEILTSIPFNEGWKAYVNGEPAKTGEFYGSFLKIHGVSGQNHVDLKYIPSGFIYGMIVSLITAMFLAITNRERLKNIGKGRRWK